MAAPTSTRAPAAPDERTVESASLAWQVHLAASQPGRAATVSLLVLGVGAWAWYWLGGPLAGLSAALVLIAGVGEFLFPIRYRLSAEGAEARNAVSWRKFRWDEVRRVYVEAGAIKLSPLLRGGRREAFRGVLLRCEANQDEVMDALRRFLEGREVRWSYGEPGVKEGIR